MKGKLCRKSNDWFVVATEGGIDYELDPQIAIQYYLYQCIELVDGEEVEFEIVDEFTDPHLYKGVGWGDGIKYARLLTTNGKTVKIYESPDKGKTIYERTVGDYTKKLHKTYLTQDEFRQREVERIAIEQYENVGDEKLFPNHTDKDIWVAGFVAAIEYMNNCLHNQNI